MASQISNNIGAVGHFRRENVELTDDFGGYLDACAQIVAINEDVDGRRLVVGRSEISELGIKVFERMGHRNGPVTLEFKAVIMAVRQNYSLVHANGKESGRAVAYDPSHHESIKLLGRRYVATGPNSTPMIYVRRVALALGLAEQSAILPADIDISASLRNFMNNLRNMVA